MEDSRILELLWARAERALEALQKKYGKLVYHIAMNILGIAQDAQECENDTYLAVWDTVPPKKPEPLRPYVCKLGRNIALNRLRTDSAQKRCSKLEVSLEELETAIPGCCMEETITARLLGRAIASYLDTQTKENRILFLRRYWLGDTVQEAAQFLGISANSASVRLSRMRQGLKEYLVREELYYEE